MTTGGRTKAPALELRLDLVVVLRVVGLVDVVLEVLRLVADLLEGLRGGLLLELGDLVVGQVDDCEAGERMSKRARAKVREGTGHSRLRLLAMREAVTDLGSTLAPRATCHEMRMLAPSQLCFLASFSICAAKG